MKGAIAAVLAVVVLGVGGWYYMTSIHATPIGKVTSNPRAYVGREIAIAGTVTERFSLFIVKYFDLRDSSGSIMVVTDKPLPAVGAQIRVRGNLKEGFSLGEQQSLVFVETPL